MGGGEFRRPSGARGAATELARPLGACGAAAELARPLGGSPVAEAVNSDLRGARVSRLRGVYAIVNGGDRACELARAAVSAGILIVQYRAKGGIDEDVARAIRAITREAGALMIVNDEWRAVERLEADGVHVGPEDAGPADLRAMRAALPDAAIGVSCGTEDEARAAQRAGADYLGVGSVFATASKSDAGDPIGLDGLARIAASTSLPVAAIGGITYERLRDVRDTGVAMAAVLSAIAVADAAGAARALVERWNST